MCELCHRVPCLPRCPNAPEQPTVYVCSGCGEPIYAGEEYWDIMGEQFCEACIDGYRGTAEYDPY